MTDELYINGTRVDMPPESGVFIDYESGILSSLDTISANYSYSIKLPKTAKNMSVVGGLFFPTTKSDFPSAKNAATLLRDGVRVVAGACVNLLSLTEDEIEITLSWGVAEKLEEIGETSIRDLYGSSESVEWSESEPIGAYMSDMRAGQYNQPVANVTDILSRIKESVGGVLTYEESVFTSWVVPMLYRNRYGTTTNWGYLSFYSLVNGVGTTSVPEVGLWCAQVGAGQGSVSPTTTSAIIGELTCYLGFYPTATTGSEAKSYKAQIYWKARYDRESAGGGDPAVLRFGWYDSTTNRVWSLLEMKPVRDLSDISREIYIYEGTCTFSDDEGYSNTRPLCFDSDSAPYLVQVDEGRLSVRVVDTDEEDGDYAIPSERVAYAENLPDITCKDFIKGVCGLFGMFPLLVGENVVLARYSELQAHAYGEVDWSDRLLQTEDTPREMDLSPDGVARSNRFAYANDEEYPETAGIVEVEDEALDETTDFLSSPFNGCPNSTSGGGVANIPLYTLENADNYDRGQEWEYEEDDGCYVLYNDGEYLRFYRFSTMLQNYYGDMARLMSGRVITERFSLDPIDLRDLDMRKVVYLRQYGAYFAVVEVKTKTEYSEVKLLTL